MKMQLRIVLLLALGVHSLHSAAIIAKRSLSSTEQQRLLKDINENRLKFAKSSKIGNMIELIYDKTLEKKADDMTNCDIKNGDYMFVTQGDIDDAGRRFSILNPMYLSRRTKKEDDKIFHPLQSKIGCAKLPAPCFLRGMEKDQMFCLIGPHSSLHTDEDIKKGELGTHCPNGSAKSGLCKAVGSSETSTVRPSTGGTPQKNRIKEAPTDDSTPTSNDGVFHSYSTLFFVLSAFISAYLC